MQTTTINAGQWFLLYVTASKVMYISPKEATTTQYVNYPATSTCAVFATLEEANQYITANGLTTPS